MLCDSIMKRRFVLERVLHEHAVLSKTESQVISALAFDSKNMLA